MRRKVRVQVDEDVMEALIERPRLTFAIMRRAGIPLPEDVGFLWLRLNLRRLTVDFRFHADEESFVRDYSRALAKGRPGIEAICFAKVRRRPRGADRWRSFLPPPVVGPGAKTRLRGVS